MTTTLAPNTVLVPVTNPVPIVLPHPAVQVLPAHLHPAALPLIPAVGTLHLEVPAVEVPLLEAVLQVTLPEVPAVEDLHLEVQVKEPANS